MGPDQIAPLRGDWARALPLIVLTVIMHAFGLVSSSDAFPPAQTKSDFALK